MEEEKHILDHIKTKKKFKVPDNYFENFHDKMLNESKNEAIVIPFYQKKSFWLVSVAASILLIFFINDFVNFDKKSVKLLSKNEPIDSLQKQKKSQIDTTLNNSENKGLVKIQTEYKVIVQEKTNKIHRAKKTSSEELLLNLNEEEILEYLNDDSIEEEDIKLLLN